MNLIPRFQTWLQVLCNDLVNYKPFYGGLVLFTYGLLRFSHAYGLLKGF